MVRARQVAQHLHIPTDSALKILQTLTQHGLIESRLGRSGGYRFNGSPGNVNLLQIVEAIDGPVSAEVPSINAADELADRLGVLRAVCEQAVQQTRAQLEQTTVAGLVQCGHGEFLERCR